MCSSLVGNIDELGQVKNKYGSGTLIFEKARARVRNIFFTENFLLVGMHRFSTERQGM